MSLLRKTLLPLLLTVGALAFSARPATANTVYFLTVGNAVVSAYPEPYGAANVVLNMDGTATITFIAFHVGAYQYLFGDGSSVAINVNATDWTVGTVSNSNSGTGFTPGPTTADEDKDGNPKGGNVSDFGTFNQTFTSFDGYTNSSSQISFTLTNNSGTWATSSDVLAANADGYSVAAHIFIATYPANQANGAVDTGFAANGYLCVDCEPTPNTFPTPDGGMTMSLLGVAIAGMGLVARRKR
jgi:hypothetical protein